MHAQNTIILIGMAFGLALLGYYVRKLILRATTRSYDAGLAERNSLHSRRITALNSDLATITQLRNQEAQELTTLRRRLNGIKATSFTSADYRNLMEITQFLALALQTWKALKGTEPTQARAEQLIKISRALEHRVFHTVEMANSLNAQPLDTQLIEWLDKRGSFGAEPELSTISFPHEAETEGYQHLRDALREAYELDIKRLAIELGQLPMEDAA
jgi:hypothetical protein